MTISVHDRLRVAQAIAFLFLIGAQLMYQMFQTLSRQSLVLRQLPVLTVSFVLASTLYKFGSFALECMAFMATWFVLDAGAQGAVWLGARLQRSQIATGSDGATTPGQIDD